MWDLSAISHLGWKNLGFIEKSLRDYWEINEIVEYSLSAHWAFVEHSLSICWARSLRDHFPWWSLRNCFRLSQNFAETVVTVEITAQSLRDYWKILVIAQQSLGALWKIWPFFHRSIISQQSPPLNKGSLKKKTNQRQLRQKGAIRCFAQTWVKLWRELSCDVSSCVLPGSERQWSVEGLKESRSLSE